MGDKWLRFAADAYSDPALKAAIDFRPWQKLARTFLMKCHNEFNLAMLGDEMGVGKVYAFRLELVIE